MAEIMISGSGLFTPKESISNEELVEAFNSYVDNFNAENAAAIKAGEIEELTHSSAAFIEKASGIKSRYVMDRSGILDPETMCPRIAPRDNDAPSILAEMAVQASEQALAQAGLAAKDIDAVLVACSNLQRAYPAIAIEVQDLLGIDGFGFDMNVACSSATFGIGAARDMIKSGSARRILVVNPEICTGHLNFRDRDSHFIFGDVCTAIVLEDAASAKGKQGFEILGTQLKTKFSNNIRNNFGFLNRAEPQDGKPHDKLFIQQGRQVFKEVVPMVADLIKTHLADSNIAVDSVKRFWLHQANLNMNDLIARMVMGDSPPDEARPTVLDSYGNTSSAGSIIAFHKYRDDFAAGDIGVICSFGAGYSIGSVLLRRG